VGYQAWLKSSGMGAYLEAYGGGDTGKREQGSYMANRCCDLARWVCCLKKEANTSDDEDDENDHTSEARERRKRRRDAANSAPSREGSYKKVNKTELKWRALWSSFFYFSSGVVAIVLY